MANMSVSEATNSMINLLPESDVQVIYAVTKSTSDKEATMGFDDPPSKYNVD